MASHLIDATYVWQVILLRCHLYMPLNGKAAAVYHIKCRQCGTTLCTTHSMPCWISQQQHGTPCTGCAIASSNTMLPAVRCTCTCEQVLSCNSGLSPAKSSGQVVWLRIAAAFSAAGLLREEKIDGTFGKQHFCIATWMESVNRSVYSSGTAAPCAVLSSAVFVPQWLSCTVLAVLLLSAR